MLFSNYLLQFAPSMERCGAEHSYSCTVHIFYLFTFRTFCNTFSYHVENMYYALDASASARFTTLLSTEVKRDVNCNWWHSDSRARVYSFQFVYFPLSSFHAFSRKREGERRTSNEIETKLSSYFCSH